MAEFKSSTFVTQVPEQKATEPPNALSLGAGQTTQSTLLLQKRRENQDMQNQLERKKDEFKKRVQQCQVKEVELAARQSELKARVLGDEHHLHNTEELRKRAQQKILIEQGEAVRKKDQAVVKRDEVKVTKLERDAQKLELSKLTKYELFLEHVVEKYADYFQEISAVELRYHTLMENVLVLRHGMTDMDDQVQTTRAKEAAFIALTSTQNLAHGITLARLQDQLEAQRASNADLEAGLGHAHMKDLERNCHLGEVQMAITNIYSMCRIRGPQGNVSDLQPLLKSIETRIVDYQAIAEAIQERRRVEEWSSPPGTASHPSDPQAGSNPKKERGDKRDAKIRAMQSGTMTSESSARD